MLVTSEGVALEETYKEMSPLRLVLRRFFRSKLSIIGLVMIIFLFVFSFLGPVIYRHKQRDTPAVHQPHEHVHALVVRAEKMVLARRRVLVVRTFRYC